MRIDLSNVLRRSSILFVLTTQFFITSTGWAYTDPLDLPAMKSALSANTVLTAVTAAGNRIVAVGPRGNVVISDDQGISWTQAKVPVSTDLVAVSFPSSKVGWAVGHGGVVIKSVDGGLTWSKVMDGNQFSELSVKFYKNQVENNSPSVIDRINKQVNSLIGDGSTKAFLDVHFETEREGFIVGTFNRIYRTEDGGETWRPWMDKTSNPLELHFYSISKVKDKTFLTGEQGMVWRLNAEKKIFEPLQTPYKGTLFGSVLTESRVLVFGMRGSVFGSDDNGQSWKKVKVPAIAGITGGIAMKDGSIVLSTQAGTVLISQDGGKSFVSKQLNFPMSYFGLANTSNNELALVGSGGVKIEMWLQKNSATNSK